MRSEAFIVKVGGYGPPQSIAQAVRIDGLSRVLIDKFCLVQSKYLNQLAMMEDISKIIAKWVSANSGFRSEQDLHEALLGCSLASDVQNILTGWNKKAVGIMQDFNWTECEDWDVLLQETITTGLWEILKK